MAAPLLSAIVNCLRYLKLNADSAKRLDDLMGDESPFPAVVPTDNHVFYSLEIKPLRAPYSVLGTWFYCARGGAKA